MSGKKLMGFEGKLYWGTAGSTADTELTIVRDVGYSFENDDADVSDRNSIINLNDVAGITFSLEFEVNNKNDDAFISAARTAIVAGNAMAFKTEDENDGFGVDGDFIVSLNESQDLRDAQRLAFTAIPTDKNGRVPTWA